MFKNYHTSTGNFNLRYFRFVLIAIIAVLGLGYSANGAKAQPAFSFKIPLGEPTLTQPSDTAVDSTGNIYVVSQSTHQIVKLSPAGVELMKIGINGGADGQFSDPQGVTVYSSDNIIVADTTKKLVWWRDK